MRRLSLSLATASMLTMVIAGTAFGAECNVPAKPDGAGQHLVVLIDPATGQATFLGTNAAGRLTGGFADVYLDLDQSGTLTAVDAQIENDVFVIANHSGKFNPAQGAPAVLPNINAGRDPAGPGKGVDG
jgi:hypothetical protein